MTESIEELIVKYTYGTWRYQTAWKKPLLVTDAEGVYFYDAQGKRYLDFTSQLIVTNLGHKNKAVIDAICEQAKKMPYIAPGFAVDVRAKVSKLLLEVMPPGLEKFFYSTSGTEANEAAMKIARMYFSKEGKYKILSRYSSYHGATASSIAATGDQRRWAIEPAGKVQGVTFAPDCYCYRCPFNLEYPDCGITCAEYVDYMIRNEGNVAAMILEPIVGTNGILVPVKEYLPRLRKITEQHDVLLIADEVMDSWGRTGEWFSVNHWNVRPDMLTTAKGCTGGYVPLGITATTRKIADYFEDHYFAHGHTYEAHPLTLYPVIAAIGEYRRLDLLSKTKKMGQYMQKRLDELKEKHKSVGDVRGIGLYWALELVRNRKTKEPFNTRVDKLAGTPLVVDKVAADCMTRGVHLLGWISHLLVGPPLIITEEQVDEGIAALDESLKIADDLTK
jgi:taurine--2-oxoglutarate transaminase